VARRGVGEMGSRQGCVAPKAGTDSWLYIDTRYSRSTIFVDTSYSCAYQSALIATADSTMTSSSADAERPRDALCPSVVSLNKITRAESFIIVT